MFIKSVTHGGYNSNYDVNDAWRKGRSNAYNDFVTNYKTALEADKATENYYNDFAKHTADNYADALKMRQNTRNEVNNFITDSNKIDDNVWRFDVDTGTRAKMRPKLDAITSSNAQTMLSGIAAKENEAVYNQQKTAGMSQPGFVKAELDATQAGNQQKISDSQLTIEKAKLNQAYMRLSDTNAYETNYVGGEVDKAMKLPENQGKSRAEVEAAIRKDPTLQKRMWDEYEATKKLLEDQIAVINNRGSYSRNHRGSGTNADYVDFSNVKPDTKKPNSITDPTDAQQIFERGTQLADNVIVDGTNYYLRVMNKNGEYELQGLPNVFDKKTGYPLPQPQLLEYYRSQGLKIGNPVNTAQPQQTEEQVSTTKGVDE